jgi:cytosine/adenosine deaminase-related metal-dependent hydrolase
MFENMRFTWNMCMPWKGTETESFSPLGFVEVIEMATIKGARALGLGDVTGSLTPGKRADLILVRTNDLNIAPLANIEAAIVQSATPANVDSVMVDGRFIKRDGRLLHYDVAKIVQRAKESAFRIRTEAGGILAPVCAGCGNPVYRGAAC